MWGENNHTFMQCVFESNFALDFFPTSNYRSNKKKICILEPKTTKKKKGKGRRQTIFKIK